jgi:phosphate transport system permease protein
MRSGRGDLLGQSLNAICGGALALNLLLVMGLLALIASMGLPYFWQKDVVQLTLADGTSLLGEVHEREAIPRSAGATSPAPTRIQLKLGNRDITGEDFRWIDESLVTRSELPPDAVVLERLEYGNFYGRMIELKRAGAVVASGADAVWPRFGPLHATKLGQLEAIRKLEKDEIGGINHDIESLRLATRPGPRSGAGGRLR